MSSNELLRAGLEVARPERDRGVDLIVYADLKSKVPSFIARPIQMKAASKEHFSINRKYEKFPDLILAFVWNLSQPEVTATYALSYPASLEIAQEMGRTATISWTDAGSYSTQKPSKQLKGLLARYEMTPEQWWERITTPLLAAKTTGSSGPKVFERQIQISESRKSD